MSSAQSLPRVGALGLGWIGRKRLEGVVQSGLARVVGLSDTNPEALAAARAIAPEAACVESYEALLDLGLDAVLIATPSALHAEQARVAFERGLAVFCQKPLARTAAETATVVAAAKSANRLLRVDLCYRQTAALQKVREIVRSGAIGDVYAGELVFHNAYGPDKAWAQDPRLAGGGCLIDLGVHLVDAALWILGPTAVAAGSAALFNQGRPVSNPSLEVEDFAVGRLRLSSGAALTITCSWRSSFGDHARIRAEFFGTGGGVAFSNVGGSFYDFACEKFHGASREALVSPPDPWESRAVLAFVRELREAPDYRNSDELVAVAGALDALYGHVQ